MTIRKLVMEATSLEIRMERRYHGKDRNDGYTVMCLHVVTDDQNRRWWLEELAASKEKKDGLRSWLLWRWCV